MNVLNRIMIAILVLSFNVGCQSTSKDNVTQVSAPETLYNDQVFPNYRSVSVESQNDIFAISDEMKLLVKEHIKSDRNVKRRANNLLDFIFSQSNLDLSYSSNANLTAIDTFKSQTANCMSLTILSYALAKEAGLKVAFQDVKVPEYWVRNGEYNLLTGHVNLKVIKSSDPHKITMWGEGGIEIDFDPNIRKRSFAKRVIDKNTVTAMFYNNKGAHAIVNSDYTTAYAYFKAASTIAPDYDASWSNMAILFRLAEEEEHAIRLYRYAISMNEDNYTALNNLAIILAKRGEYLEAQNIKSSLHSKRLSNPYYHALLGDEAIHNKQFDVAVKHYKRAIKINKRVHEFYYGLSKAYANAGDFDAAKNSMKKAIRLNKTDSIEKQYVAKLSFLSQSRGIE